MFYIGEKRKTGKKMRIETDREFEQNKIRKLNEKYNIDMFSLKVCGSKGFAAEQKIRLLRKHF